MGTHSTSGIRTFRDAVVIVTGGASGIGAATSRELGRRGAHVVLADRQLDLASEVAGSIAAAGGSAEAAELDVRDAAAVEALVAGTFEKHGRLDYLFNNAGIGVGGELRDYRLEDWRDVVEVNLMGVAHGVQAAYRRMTAQGFGHIVNTASIAGLVPSPFTGSYTATKHAVVGLTRALRIEGAHYGVRASTVCPGVIRTPILLGGKYGRHTKPIDVAKQLGLWNRLRPIEADVFARELVSQVAVNRGVIIVPGWWKAVCWLQAVAPFLGNKVAADGFREVKRIADEAQPPQTG